MGRAGAIVLRAPLMQQLPLGVRIPDRAVFESYFPGTNVQTFEHLTQIAAGTVAPSEAHARAGRDVGKIGRASCRERV